MKEISIKEIEHIKIGNAENKEAGTGCTVIIAEQGAPAGLDVRGGGPASRESELLKPLAAAQVIHAVLLSGGSAFGLDAAGGVMEYLEKKQIGFDVGITKVPLVCQSCLFDLGVGDYLVRPDKAMGYEACVNAEKGNYIDGNAGAGTGATVGKFRGREGCMKSGIGSYALQIGELQVGAIVAVNALGDVYDWKNGKKVAGVLAVDKKTFLNTEEEFYRSYEEATTLLATTLLANELPASKLPASELPVNKLLVEKELVEKERAEKESAEKRLAENTTIGVVITNAAFQKTQLCKIAAMAQNGCARSIRPVHTSADGDSLYAMSVGTVAASPDLVGTLAAQVVSEAILRAVMSAEPAYGLPAAKDLAAKELAG